MPSLKALTLAAILSSVPALLLTGCEDKKAAPAPPANTTGAPADDHDHDHAHDHDHDHDHDHAHNADGSHPADNASAPGHGGPVIDLGTLVVGPFNAIATRDAGDIVPGKDGAFDVTITPVEGSALQASAVRFWIGTEDAKGSVKAKAAIEDPKAPNRWHTHAEVPSPMPAGSKFWFEIEDDKGGTHLGSFELKN